MRVTTQVENFRGDLDVCIRECVDELVEILEDVHDFQKGTRTSSEALKDELDPYFQAHAWTPKSLIARSFPVSELPAANYYIDWQKKVYCVHQHKTILINFEYCFDNRQAIGTNFLKVEASSKRAGDSELVVGLMLTGTKQALRAMGWDGGVAATEEYWNALRHVYAQSIQTGIILLSINQN
jgi:hypothetical protein